MFIQSNSREFPVLTMCRVLGVKSGSYYAWQSRPESKRDKENQQLMEEIKKIHKKSRGTYGSPRIHATLNKEGKIYGLNRVARLMNEAQIQATKRKKYIMTTDSKHSLPLADNYLNRVFEAENPNEVWLADITYIWTDEGWLYLAAVLDIYSRRIVGWSMADNMRVELTLTALEMAIEQRQPDAGLLHHSDRGSQYAATQYQALLKANEMNCSMSRKGNCWDNAPMESFFDTLKTELVYQQRYKTRAQARSTIFEYIESFYNRERIHSSIGYTSPEKFESTKEVANG